MSDRDEVKFPWFKLLWNSVFWAILVMIALGALIWFFGKEQIQGTFEGATFWGSLFGNLLIDLAIALLVLVPSFYAGMFACVRLEKRGGRYKGQFDATFRVVSTFVFALIFLIWAWISLLPFDEMSFIDGFRAVRLLVIYYVFDNYVIDGLWEDVFQKR